MNREVQEIMPIFTPWYILDEIEIYVGKIKDGKKGIYTFENILALISLAVASGRINKIEGEEIRNKLYEIEKLFNDESV